MGLKDSLIAGSRRNGRLGRRFPNHWSKRRKLTCCMPVLCRGIALSSFYGSRTPSAPRATKQSLAARRLVEGIGGRLSSLIRWSVFGGWRHAARPLVTYCMCGSHGLARSDRPAPARLVLPRLTCGSARGRMALACEVWRTGLLFEVSGDNRRQDTVGWSARTTI
jgi:hypothetical protein